MAINLNLDEMMQNGTRKIIFTLAVLLASKTVVDGFSNLMTTRQESRIMSEVTNPHVRKSTFIKEKEFILRSSAQDDDLEYDNKNKFAISGSPVLSNEKKLPFSALMALSGALLGPFLDSYHSAFGVLRYDNEISFILPFLGGTDTQPALTTTWWVPELFGLAGFIIGWLYILLDEVLIRRNSAEDSKNQKLHPSPPLILLGISCFTFQYYLSGLLYQMGVDRTIILGVMSTLAAAGFWAFDGTVSGLLTSIATAIGGPVIEVGLISTLAGSGYGYHYSDSGETVFFPLWILPGESMCFLRHTCMYMDQNLTKRFPFSLLLGRSSGWQFGSRNLEQLGKPSRFTK